jgi:hypothetical protein
MPGAERTKAERRRDEEDGGGEDGGGEDERMGDGGGEDGGRRGWGQVGRKEEKDMGMMRVIP